MLAASTDRFRPDLPFTRRLESLRELGFSRFEARLDRGALPPHVDARELRAQGASISDVLVGNSDAGGLADRDESRRSEAVGCALEAGRWALSRGTRLVVVDPGKVDLVEIDRFEGRVSGLLEDVGGPGEEEALRLGSLRARIAEEQLRQLCRSLHQALRVLPDVLWCIPTPQGPSGLPLAQELSWVLEDLGETRLRYWHRTAGAETIRRLAFGDVERWYESFGPLLAGVHIEDLAADGSRLLPGMGTVDFRGLGSVLPQDAERVLGIPTGTGLLEIRAALDFLETNRILLH